MTTHQSEFRVLTAAADALRERFVSSIWLHRRSVFRFFSYTEYTSARCYTERVAVSETPLMPGQEKYNDADLEVRRERRRELIMALAQEVVPQSTTKLDIIENRISGVTDELKKLQMTVFEKIFNLQQEEHHNYLTIMQLTERLDAMELEVKRLKMITENSFSTWNIVD